jgi:glycosyltransferase involved in cell wall biosynthesis
MRVAQVHNVKHDVANGIYKTVAGLATHLPSVGIEVEAWHFEPAVSQVTFREVRGVTVIDLPARARGRAMLMRLPAVTRDFIRQRQAQVDLVHFHSVFIPNNPWLARSLRLPYVVTPNGGYSQAGLVGSNRLFKSIWMTWQERDYLRRASAVLAVSEAERDDLTRRWPDLTVRYTANAIELEPAPPAPRPPSNDFVFVGRLAIDHKGLDRMIRGFARFIDAAGPASPARLLLAGPDWRGSQAALQAMVAERRLSDRILLLGPMFGDAKAKLMAGARAFVHTSRWEGLPFAMLEAMTLGTPTLLTPETNMGDVVARYQAGLVVDGADDGAIASGFERLARLSDAAHAEMSRAARRLVEENYTWPVAIAQVKAAYEEAVARGPSGTTASPLAAAAI